MQLVADEREVLEVARRAVGDPVGELLDWAAEMLSPEQAPSSELLYGRPAEGILAAWIELEDVCLDLAEEARALAGQLRR